MATEVEPGKPNPFNSPFEAGIRSTIILASAFPEALDLQRMVVLDYLTVHSSDADGPESLHAAVPLRSGELLVRRQLVERGLQLMISKELIEREFLSEGVFFRATEAAVPFICTLTTVYSTALKLRADWAIHTFGGLTTKQITERTSSFFKKWDTEFQGNQTPGMLF